MDKLREYHTTDHNELTMYGMLSCIKDVIDLEHMPIFFYPSMDSDMKVSNSELEDFLFVEIHQTEAIRLILTGDWQLRLFKRMNKDQVEQHLALVNVVHRAGVVNDE